MDQPKWDERYLSMCKHIAGWSKDPSTKVGAVIVDPLNNSIVSLGYNGLPRGVLDIPARLMDRDAKLRMTVHAELNAILFANRSVRGFTIYTWPFSPCSNCAGVIIQAGIKRVVAPMPSPEIEARWGEILEVAYTMFSEAGVRLNLEGME